MPDHEETHSIAAIRKCLMAFDDPNLDAFTHDHYPAVYDRFTRGLLKDEKITLLLDHCRRIDGELGRLAASAEVWTPRPTDPPPPTSHAPYLPPRSLPDFVGRQDELQSLDAALVPGSRTAITGLIGMGGIGKTELAKLAASRAASRFRDGILWADCATQSLATIADLWAAAYKEQLLGDDPTTKAGAWRGLVAAKEALLIFDNLQPNQEIESLFPARGRSAMLITTRDARHLALEGAERLDLDHFSFDEALDLARRVLGAEQAEAQTAAARCLFDLLGYLPLAVAVALHIARDSGWTLDTLASRLEAAGALQVLGDDDRLHKSLNATFNTACQTLSPDLQRTFAALALFNTGPSFATAALADTLALNLPEAQARLSVLSARSLLHSAGEGRWSLHPLLREFAAAQGSPDDDAAMRFARHYAQVASVARNLVQQGGDDQLRGLTLVDQEWSHISQGQSWVVARSAEDDEAAVVASQFHYDFTGRIDRPELCLPPRDKIRWLQAAATATRQLSDKGAEGVYLGIKGLAYAVLGDARRAIGYYEQALVIDKEIGDRRGEGVDLSNLGIAYETVGNLVRAREVWTQALAIYEAIKDPGAVEVRRWLDELGPP